MSETEEVWLVWDEEEKEFLLSIPGNSVVHLNVDQLEAVEILIREAWGKGQWQ